MDGRHLEKLFGIRTMRLVNDFVAAGYGTLTLRKDEVKVLQEGEEDLSKPIGVIGAGTGQFSTTPWVCCQSACLPRVLGGRGRGCMPHFKFAGGSSSPAGRPSYSQPTWFCLQYAHI